MPYIAPGMRKILEPELNALIKRLDAGHKVDTFDWNAGVLNYLFTKLALAYIKTKGESYQNYNDIIGALEGCKLELYRQHIQKYEDKKIITNGDIS